MAEPGNGTKISLADTHPALSDRLHALSQEPRLALPLKGETADSLHGVALQPISDSFDRSWQESIAQTWGERHQQVQEGRKQLADLDIRVETG
jgi:hypothetical protein